MLPNTLCTMKRSPFPDSSAERTSYVLYPLAGMPGTIPLISRILSQSKIKIQRRSLWNSIMDLNGKDLTESGNDFGSRIMKLE